MNTNQTQRVESNIVRNVESIVSRLTQVVGRYAKNKANFDYFIGGRYGAYLAKAILTNNNALVALAATEANDIDVFLRRQSRRYKDEVTSQNISKPIQIIYDIPAKKHLLPPEEVTPLMQADAQLPRTLNAYNKYRLVEREGFAKEILYTYDVTPAMAGLYVKVTYSDILKKYYSSWYIITTDEYQQYLQDGILRFSERQVSWFYFYEIRMSDTVVNELNIDKKTYLKYRKQIAGHLNIVSTRFYKYETTSSLVQGIDGLSSGVIQGFYITALARGELEELPEITAAEAFLEASSANKVGYNYVPTEILEHFGVK